MYERTSIGGLVHFQPSRTYVQHDLTAVVLVPNINETMTDALASVDKSMYPSVALRELATITSDYAMDDVAVFAVNDRNY
jgi:hypothetical protein